MGQANVTLVEEVSAEDRSFQKSMSWDKRAALIRERFPSVETLDWKVAFDHDEDIFARIMRDVLKADQAVPGRPGPRPAIEYDKGMETLKRLMGQDFCTIEFTGAFKVLAGGRSLTQVARKTGLSRSHCYRLLRGDVQPKFEDMKAIAEGFGKHPSFFAEYRAAYVIAHLESRLMQMPESTIDFYRLIREALR